MLYIATELKDKNWLIYVLEEFRRINRANFDIKVIAIDNEDVFKDSNALYYTKKFIKGKAIIDRQDVLPNSKLKYLSEDLFVIDKTTTPDERFLCCYDLFWNAFVFLSRLEEYLNNRVGKDIRSYSFNHPRKDKTTFSTPVVNNLFNELEKIIADNFIGLTFGKKQKPLLELSHDVDYISKTAQLRIKQTALNLYGALLSVYRPEKFFRKILKSIKFIFSNPSYWCFDYWAELEKKFNQQSVFYVYAQSSKAGLKAWLIDPSYDISDNQRLRQALMRLISEGFEIGLHGSLRSAQDKELASQEKEILEKSLGQRISKVRQHWLRYEENITPYIHNGLFSFDSTLGWNDRPGFRAAVASKYRPYDHKNQKPFSFFEIPLVVMDSVICGCRDSKDQIASKVINMWKQLEKYKDVHVSVCWHQRVCNSDYNWNGVYQKLLMAI